MKYLPTIKRIGKSAVYSVGMLLLFWGLVWVMAPSSRVILKPLTSNDFKTIAVEEHQDRVRVHETELAAQVYTTHGCDGSLAEWTSQYALENGISARVVAGVVVVESTCRPDVVSHSGATGLMQIMPRIHKVSKEDLLNPEMNIRIGTRVLATYIHEQGGIYNGLRYYYGVAEGSDDQAYARNVLSVAGLGSNGEEINDKNKHVDRRR